MTASDTSAERVFVGKQATARYHGGHSGVMAVMERWLDSDIAARPSLNLNDAQTTLRSIAQNRRSLSWDIMAASMGLCHDN